MAEGSGISLPAAPAQTPGLPENFHPIAFETFNGLDTQVLRPAVKEDMCAWLDGWMPIAPSHVRTLWGTGPIVYTIPSGIVEWFGFGNIADQQYMIVVRQDGGIDAVALPTNVSTNILGPGTIVAPSTIFGFSQWGSQYLIFAKDQPSGYWLWDGVNVYTAGTLGPQVTINDPGTGYDGSPVTFDIQTNGSLSGAMLVAQELNGGISNVTVSNPGTGAAVGDFFAVYVLGGGSDNQAALQLPTISTTTGGVNAAYVNTGGVKYSGNSYVNISGGGGSGATFSLGIQNGVIVSIAVVSRGTGFTSAPALSVVDPMGTGSGATIFCTVSYGEITGIPVGSGGSGYTSSPTITILGDGTGATAVAEINGGAVVSIAMTNSGEGYSKAVAQITGGNNAANVSVEAMPFGVSGTAVEVYQQRVWISNGAALAVFPPKNRTIFSSANSPVDFSSNGGAFQSTDSFLRVGYHFLKQTNGFLYLGGDSSLNYISGVQTTSQGSAGTTAIATTTFNNLNADPQFGSPWPSSVQVFNRNIVFATSLGIYVSYGGSVKKESYPLDGFYTSVPLSGQANFSSAVANIFGINVYMLLLPVYDEITQAFTNKLLMWDGKKWFTSQQDRSLIYVSTQEINSILVAYGTDGTNIFPLFQTPTTNFSKVIQSKLYSDPAYWTTKTATRLHGVVNAYAVDSDLNISIDNENGTGTGNAFVSVPPGTPGTWPGGSWSGTWYGKSFGVFGPYPIGQSGRMTGVTVQTTASNLALLSIGWVTQTFETNI